MKCEFSETQFAFCAITLTFQMKIHTNNESLA